MSAYSQQVSNIRKTWLLIFVFVGFISALFYLFGAVNNAPGLALVGILLSLSQAAVGYFWGDKIALASARAKEVSYDQAPQIHEMVTNLSKIARIPKPKIFISPDRSANAFACGHNPKNAKVCLNQGLLNLLDKPEIEGVIAHELAHIKNRDILIMTVTMVLASVASFVADIGFRFAFFGRLGRRDNENNTSPLVYILYFLTLILAPIVGALIQMAVSRQREFLADATAVVFTRYPNGLKNALLKLHKSPIPADNYSTAMNHFYISEPKKKFGEKVSNLFNTHPPVTERVAALEKM